MENSTNKRYLLLIGASLIFLFTFLVIWNLDNYRSEKDKLVRDLSQQMTLACSAYRDSIVQDIFSVISIQTDGDDHSLPPPRFQRSSNDSNYFETIVFSSGVARFDDEVSISVQLGDSAHFSHGAFPERVSDLANQVVAWRSDSTDRFSFEIPSDTVWSVIEKDTAIFFPDLRGLRKNKDNIIPQSYLDIDSIFTNKLTSNNLPIDHVLSIEDSITLNSDNIIIDFEYESFNVLNQSPPVALFTGYQGYIIKAVLTPLITSLFLFSLVGLSFYFIISKWREQERATRIRRAFMSNMTHELKTPLATVGIALEALDTYDVLDDKSKSQEYIDISRKELSRLNLLVDKVLKLSTHENEIGELHMEQLDLNNIVEDVLKTMKIHFGNTNSIIECSLAEGSTDIMGDKVHLTNAIYNLLDNAIKYSDESPRISVQTERKANNLLLRIADNGMGIPKAYHDKVFERLFRVPTDDVHNVKGYGLGLHYVAEVIKAHKGRVSIESEVDKGSTFIIQLPLQS